MNNEMTTVEFVPMAKTPRLSREVVITEKIDGTSGTIFIDESGATMLVGSRTQWITPENDNYGFARWARANEAELLKLGPGWHRGEWWGSGIQRGYGLPKGEKRFSLFNTTRWCLHGQTPMPLKSSDPTAPVNYQDVLPPCVGLVPVLYVGIFLTEEVEHALRTIKELGSFAAPGYRNPEGVVVYHTGGGVCFKKTIQKDEEPKSVTRGSATLVEAL